MYCQKCGGRLESYASNCAFCGTPVPKYDTKVNYVNAINNTHSGKRPMTAWKWIGFYLLPCIPVIGSIIQIVLIFKWAFSNHDDLSLKGFARAQLIIVLFAIILVVGIFALLMYMPDLFENIPLE